MSELNTQEYDYFGSHTFNSFVYTHKTAQECLLRAQQNPEGSHYLYLACLTFCSFTVEAYLNHIGEAELRVWKASDKISIDVKIDKLRVFNICIEKGQAHFQRLKTLYGFRNRIAHGKTKSVKYSANSISNITDMHRPAEKEFWGIDISQEECIKAINDVEDFVKGIHAQLGKAGNPFISLGSGSGVRKYKE